MSKFTIVNEKYEIKDGEVIGTFKVGNNPKEYILYTSTDYNYNEMSILVGALEYDEKGMGKIKSIENDKEREIIISKLKGIIGG